MALRQLCTHLRRMAHCETWANRVTPAVRFTLEKCLSNGIGCGFRMQSPLPMKVIPKSRAEITADVTQGRPGGSNAADKTEPGMRKAVWLF